VRQVQDPIQANARGAAFIAGVGLGTIGFGDVPQLVAFKRIYQPTPEHRAVYDDRFEIFVKIYQQMKGVYRKLNRGDDGSK
jgi:xylulokinase